ncbi:MAG: T9SS type A sorting domain-containing protein, partial [Bacteroidota bacterium]
SSAPAGNQWYFEGNPIPGANGQTHVATLSGWYWCLVTLNECSSDTSNHVHVIITGVEELLGATVRVYPIPNNGNFTVSIDTKVRQCFTIMIYNFLGQSINNPIEIISDENFEQYIDLRPIPTGVYTLVIMNSECRIVRKILVNK